MATAENRVGPAILQTAQESCMEAIALEKKLASAGRLVSILYLTLMH